MKNLFFIGSVIVAAIVFYLVFPKYEIFQSAGDGTVTYRFNKITGKLESCYIGKKWEESTPLSFIKRP